MDLLLRLLVGHIIGDFVLQNRKIAKLKTESYSYLILHVLLVFLSLVLCTINYFSWKLILCLFFISLVHLFDYCKKFAKNLSGHLVFLIDQVMHLTTIIIAPLIFGLIDMGYITNIFVRLYMNTTIWVYFGGYIFSVFAGRIIIDILLRKSYNSSFLAPSNLISAYIGMVERLIVLTLALLSEYTAIGIIFAIKGAARKMFIEKDEQNGEYYFLGTGLSFLIAIISALAIKGLLKIEL